MKKEKAKKEEKETSYFCVGRAASFPSLLCRSGMPSSCIFGRPSGPELACGCLELTRCARPLGARPREHRRGAPTRESLLKLARGRRSKASTCRRWSGAHPMRKPAWNLRARRRAHSRTLVGSCYATYAWLVGMAALLLEVFFFSLQGQLQQARHGNVTWLLEQRIRGKEARMIREAQQKKCCIVEDSF